MQAAPQLQGREGVLSGKNAGLSNWTSSGYNRNAMNPARIADLLEPFLGGHPLTSLQLSDISTYIDILLRWNARINLTAIRDPEEIVVRHFGESLFAARHLFPLVISAPSGVNESSVADLGSGAGFPGLPIKLWAPHVSLTLIESNHKKATFLREVVRSLTLTGIDIQSVRAETLPVSSYGVVTLRAVERFAAALPIAASLVKDGGRLALLVSTTQLPELHSALPGHEISALLPIPCSTSRILALAQKRIRWNEIG